MCIHFLSVAADIQLLCLHWENLKWRKWSTAGKGLFTAWHSLSRSWLLDVASLLFPRNLHVGFPVTCIWIHRHRKHSGGNLALQVLTGNRNNSDMDGFLLCVLYFGTILHSFCCFWKFLNCSYLKVLGNYFIGYRKRCPGFGIRQAAHQILVFLLTWGPSASDLAFWSCRFPVFHRENRISALRDYEN